ncbi:MAG: MBL fold metallo-hydrolase [Bacteroidales bacterium]|nr:MBL fold metallo-hydrolase [Candidatus Colimorpha merdihippi]MCQ2281537.1 MBL fold metallo-hydrolase [Bacteroidales bacterium]
MEIKQFVFNHFQVNCFIVWDASTKDCYIIDPGCEELYEYEQLYAFVDKNELHPQAIMLTHAHIDHICGLRDVCDHYHLPVSLHADGKKLLGQAELYGSVMNFRTKPLDDLDCRFIEHGDHIGPFECRHVPGHCPGSLAFILHDERVVITGDALFRGSIGRTDLPGGNYDTLMHSIYTQLLTLDDLFEVLPGHGDTSTIGEEKMYNGFLQVE